MDQGEVGAGAFVHTITDLDRRVFGDGLRASVAPWHPDDAVAQALGYRRASELGSAIGRLSGQVVHDRPMSIEDWRDLIAITEVVALTNVLGNRSDWSAVSGCSPHDALDAIERAETAISAHLHHGS